MGDREKSFENMTDVMAESIEQVRKAANDYLQLFDKSISIAPWAQTDLNKKLRNYAERNVASAFAFAEKLIRAKDFKDLLRVQTEFVQAQIEAMTAQSKDLAEAARKETEETLKKIKPAS